MKDLIEIPSILTRPVRKVSHEELNPNMETNTYNSHAVLVTTAMGTTRKVNDCSKDYQLIRNSAIIQPIIDGLSGDFPIEVTGRAWNEAVFRINIAIKKNLMKLQKDQLFPMISILNSYNGKIRCTVEMGIWRLVCTNGLSLPTEVSSLKEYSHTPSNEESLAVGNILKAFEDFYMNAAEVIEIYDDLKVSPVSNIENRVEEVIENTAFPAKFQDEVIDRINIEMASFKPTDWLVYNGFNYQFNHHEELLWDPKKRTRVDKEILSYLLNN